MIPEFSKGQTFCFLINSQVFLWPNSVKMFSLTTYGKTLKVTDFSVKVKAVTAHRHFSCSTVIFYTEVFYFWSKVTCFYKWKQQKHFHTLSALKQNPFA